MTSDFCFGSSLRRRTLRPALGCQLCQLWGQATDTRPALLGACSLYGAKNSRTGNCTAGAAGPASTPSPGSRRRAAVRHPNPPAQRAPPDPADLQLTAASQASGGASATAARRHVSGTPRKAEIVPTPVTAEVNTQLPYSPAAGPDLDQLSALVPALNLDDILAGKPLSLDLLLAGSSDSGGSGATTGAGFDTAAVASGDGRGDGEALRHGVGGPGTMSGLTRRALRPWEKAAAPPTPTPVAAVLPSAQVPQPPTPAMETETPSGATTKLGGGGGASLPASSSSRRGNAADAAQPSGSPRQPATGPAGSASGSVQRAAAASASATAAPAALKVPSVSKPLASTSPSSSSSIQGGTRVTDTATSSIWVAPGRPSVSRGPPASSAAPALTPTALDASSFAATVDQYMGRGAAASADRAAGTMGSAVAAPPVGGAGVGAGSASAAGGGGDRPGLLPQPASRHERPEQPAAVRPPPVDAPPALSAPPPRAQSDAGGVEPVRAAEGAGSGPAAPLVGGADVADEGQAADTTGQQHRLGLGVGLLRFAGAAPLSAASAPLTAAAGGLAARSTRAPRAARVCSKEWVAAAQAVEVEAAAPPQRPPGGKPAAVSTEASGSSFGSVPSVSVGPDWRTSSALIPETVSEPRGVLVLHEEPLRAALEAAAAAPAALPSRAELPETVDRRTWRLHAAVLFPDLYDADWHGCLFDFLFELWPEVGRAHITAPGAAATGSRRLLLTTDAELAEAVAADAGVPATAPPPSPVRAQRAAALLDDAYAFAHRCFASTDFAVRSAVVVSALDCMDDHDALMGPMAARLPRAMVQRLLVPLAPRFQPPWAVEEWLGAVMDAYPGYELVSTVPRRWQQLMDRLEEAQVVYPSGGLGVVHAALDFPEEDEERRQAAAGGGGGAGARRRLPAHSCPPHNSPAGFKIGNDDDITAADPRRQEHEPLPEAAEAAEDQRVADPVTPPPPQRRRRTLARGTAAATAPGTFSITASATGGDGSVTASAVESGAASSNDSGGQSEARDGALQRKSKSRGVRIREGVSGALGALVAAADTSAEAAAVEAVVAAAVPDTSSEQAQVIGAKTLRRRGRRAVVAVATDAA